MEEYLKRQKRLEIKKKFIEGMSVEEFLQYFEDPEKVLLDRLFVFKFFLFFFFFFFFVIKFRITKIKLVWLFKCFFFFLYTGTNLFIETAIFSMMWWSHARLLLS